MPAKASAHLSWIVACRFHLGQAAGQGFRRLAVVGAGQDQGLRCGCLRYQAEAATGRREGRHAVMGAWFTVT